MNTLGVICAIGVIAVVGVVLLVGYMRTKPGFRRKRPDPGYVGPERRHE